MTKKTLRKSLQRNAVQPLLALILVGTALPLVSMASIYTVQDFETGGDNPWLNQSSSSSSVTEGTDAFYKNHASKQEHRDLFDAVQFRRQVRSRGNQEVHVVPTPEDTGSSSSSAANPCDPAAAPSAESVAPVRLQIDDLTGPDQQQMKINLRHGGCPYNVIGGYRELCERLLKARGSPYKEQTIVKPAVK